jgi:ribonuclease HI
MSKTKIEIYSDGSGNTFDSDGGWGFVMVVDGKKLKEGSGYLAKATNNTAELTAAIQGLKYVDAYIQAAKLTDHEVILISDSQLVLGYASGLYKCKALHLSALFIEIKNLYNSLKATTRWVKGHSGDEHNEACDVLAGNARANKGVTNVDVAP